MLFLIQIRHLELPAELLHKSADTGGIDEFLLSDKMNGKRLLSDSKLACMF